MRSSLSPPRAWPRVYIPDLFIGLKWAATSLVSCLLLVTLLCFEAFVWCLLAFVGCLVTGKVLFTNL